MPPPIRSSQNSSFLFIEQASLSFNFSSFTTTFVLLPVCLSTGQTLLHLLVDALLGIGTLTARQPDQAPFSNLLHSSPLEISVLPQTMCSWSRCCQCNRHWSTDCTAQPTRLSCCQENYKVGLKWVILVPAYTSVHRSLTSGCKVLSNGTHQIISRAMDLGPLTQSIVEIRLQQS